MSATPPVPKANQSPYPLQEPRHDTTEVSLPPVMRGGDPSLVDRARDLPLVAVGAAIGLGAAVVGGLVYGLTRWSDDSPKKRRRKKKSA